MTCPTFPRCFAEANYTIYIRAAENSWLMPSDFRMVRQKLGYASAQARAMIQRIITDDNAYARFSANPVAFFVQEGILTKEAATTGASFFNFSQLAVTVDKIREAFLKGLDPEIDDILGMQRLQKSSQTFKKCTESFETFATCEKEATESLGEYQYTTVDTGWEPEVGPYEPATRENWVVNTQYAITDSYVFFQKYAIVFVAGITVVLPKVLLGPAPATPQIVEADVGGLQISERVQTMAYDVPVTFALGGFYSVEQIQSLMQTYDVEAGLNLAGPVVARDLGSQVAPQIELAAGLSLGGPMAARDLGSQVAPQIEIRAGLNLSGPVAARDIGSQVAPEIGRQAGSSLAGPVAPVAVELENKINATVAPGPMVFGPVAVRECCLRPLGGQTQEIPVEHGRRIGATARYFERPGGRPHLQMFVNPILPLFSPELLFLLFVDKYSDR